MRGGQQLAYEIILLDLELFDIHVFTPIRNPQVQVFMFQLLNSGFIFGHRWFGFCDRFRNVRNVFDWLRRTEVTSLFQAR